MDPIIARLGMPVPVDRLFDFLIPEELQGDLAVGQRVRVSFSGRRTTGIVVELAAESSFDGPLARIEQIVEGPILPIETLEICRLVAKASYAPLGLCINRILPGSITRVSRSEFHWQGSLADAEQWLADRGKRAPRQADVVRLLLRTGGGVDDATLRGALGSSGIAAAKRLAAEPEGLVCRIESAPLPQAAGGASDVAPLCLSVPEHTQVIDDLADRWTLYYELIDDIVLHGGAALVLAPTVLQVEQLAEIWRQRAPVRSTSTSGTRGLAQHEPEPDAGFGGDSLAAGGPAVGIYHSDLSEGTRGWIWEQSRHGRISVLFGTRSALFVPLAGCRLVVVEDEHDSGYKQEEQLPYYDARNVARSVATSIGASLVLASATPSMETVWSLRDGSAERITTSTAGVAARAGIDATIVSTGYGEDVLHPLVTEAIHQSVCSGDRAMIVASRLGSFQCVVCRACGRTIRCPNCGGTLAYDQRAVQLHCRMCGHIARQPRCGTCGTTDLRFVGVGTAAVETAAREAFPGESIIRLDATTLQTSAARKQARDALWGDERGRQPRILVVSPMAAMGPTLRGLGCAAVVGIDAILAQPNFRASEQAFQLLAGVRGRMEHGMLYIQTRFPEHDVLVTFGEDDADRFVEQELAHRQAMFYPPFSRLAQLRIPADAQRKASLVARVEKALRRLPVAVLGPSPTPATGAKSVTMLLKAKDSGKLRTACDAVHSIDPRIEINRDPVWF